MSEVTTPVETRRPVGQGNPDWLKDATQGKGPAHPRKPAAKSAYVPPAGTLASPPAQPTPEGNTATPARSAAEPVQPMKTPEVPVSVKETPATPAATVDPVQTLTTIPAQPEPVTEQPKAVVTVDDPNAIIQIKNPDGSITEKSAATIKWEENMRKNVTQKNSKLDLKEKELQNREREIAAREEALKNAPAQPQTTITAPAATPAPEMPLVTDPEYDVKLAKFIARQVEDGISKGINPLVELINDSKSSQDEKNRQTKEANEVYAHNFHLTNDVLPTVLPFDLDALKQSDPQAYKEALGRIRTAAAAEGIDISTEGIKSIGTKLDPNLIRVIGLSAVSDGWNPTLKKVAPAAPVPKVNPVAAELAAKLAAGEGLVPKADPTQPLIPVAPSGSPAVSTANKTQMGNSSSTVPKWAQPLGLGKSR